MADIEYRIVDAFTNRPFEGNPAAVVLDAQGLSDDQMQRIAREFNLSETTFILPPEDSEASLRIRWFTPGQEVSMCGHATLAGIHALLEEGRYVSLLDEPDMFLPIETRGGLLKARCEKIGTSDGVMIWLDLIDPTLTPFAFHAEEWSPLLGIPAVDFEAGLPSMLTQDGDLLVFVCNFQTLVSAQPDFGALGKFCKRAGIRGVSVVTLETPSPSLDGQSRFFAPAAGIDEDPVTGSVHGPLGVYLVVNEQASFWGDLAALSFVQSVPGGRTGYVRVLVKRQAGRKFQAAIGGQCVETMRGRLTI
jgi:PhzF family phenazine biosynthesis protein